MRHPRAVVIGGPVPGCPNAVSPEDDSAPPAGTMTGTNAIVSIPTNCEGCTEIVYQAGWVTTPTGTLTLEESNEYDPKLNPTGRFTTVPSGALIGAVTNPAGAAGSTVLRLQSPAKWVRCRYVNSSGSGTLIVTAQARGVY